MSQSGATSVWRSIPLAFGLVTLVAQTAAAHIPELRGHLVDLVGRSNLIVVGTVVDVQPATGRDSDITMQVEARFLGDYAERALTFHAHSRPAPGERLVFFLRRDADTAECLQATGTVFPSRRQDDAVYRDTAMAISAALLLPEGARETALGTALIPALSASSPPLRYQAVLELAGLAHHGLSPSVRQSLARLVADPATDPAILTTLVSVLRSAPETTTVSAMP